MNKVAVIIYGPPGAGKGTQANLLSWKRDYFHFDAGRYLESIVRDPKNKSNKIIQREKKLFDQGKLMTPSWVLKMIRKQTLAVGRAGLSSVYSGSPRTMLEAFGDLKNAGLVDTLESQYGKKNLFFIYLDVKPQTSIKRNSSRKVCSVCSTVISGRSKISHCPICLGSLRKRTLDNPKVIVERLKEYRERTLPILKKLKERGFKVYKVNAEPLPAEVFKTISHIVPK